MFIVFEGGEGVGKTTQIDRVYQAFNQKNLPCIKTREPGGTPFAEKIRHLFKEKTDDSPTALTELFLICAARAQHIEKIIRPALAQHKIILCDRFLDSTYVYQHILGKIPKQEVDLHTSPILQDLLPNLTFILHCPKNLSISRVEQEKNRQPDRLDSYDSEIQNTILEGYKKVFDDKLTYPCQHIPNRVLIDASTSVEEVFRQIKATLKQYLNILL